MARKRLGLHVDLKKSSARKKSGSPPTSIEVVAARVEAKRAREVAKEEVEAPVRKSKRLVRGKAKIVVPTSPKRKDLPKLDEVPRKKRKFLDASATAAVKVNLSQPSDTKLAIPTEVVMAEAQLALPAPESVVEEVVLEVQEAPLEVQEILLESLEVQSPTLMIQGVLGELDPAGEVVNVSGAAEEEEEGSSSTPEKEDAEDGKVAGVVQIFDSPIKRPVAPVVADPSLELAQAPPQDETVLMVEESIPDGDAGDPEALGPEEEAQVTLPWRRQSECLRLYRRSTTLRHIMSD